MDMSPIIALLVQTHDLLSIYYQMPNSEIVTVAHWAGNNIK